MGVVRYTFEVGTGYDDEDRVNYQRNPPLDKKCRIRFIGLTGHHDPAVLLEAMRRFPFDSLLVAINPADARQPGSGSDAGIETRGCRIHLERRAQCRLLPASCFLFSRFFQTTV